MSSVSSEASFIVWGSNYTPYGPVELGTLVSLVKDARVTADTWVYALDGGAWLKAGHLPELSLLFRSGPCGATQGVQRGVAIEPSELRRIHVLAALSDTQLEQFARYLRVQLVSEGSLVVRQGEPGDSMFLIYEGELLVRILALGQELTLATLGQGEFFGDISLFDPGPRSADVVASRDSTLLTISCADFNELADHAPDLATPFLLAIGKTLTARIRSDNTRWSSTEASQNRPRLR